VGGSPGLRIVDPDEGVIRIVDVLADAPVRLGHPDTMAGVVVLETGDPVPGLGDADATMVSVEGEGRDRSNRVEG
jgi:hypothetical protein